MVATGQVTAFGDLAARLATCPPETECALGMEERFNPTGLTEMRKVA